MLDNIDVNSVNIRALDRYLDLFWVFCVPLKYFEIAVPALKCESIVSEIKRLMTKDSFPYSSMLNTCKLIYLKAIMHRRPIAAPEKRIPALLRISFHEEADLREYFEVLLMVMR